MSLENLKCRLADHNIHNRLEIIDQPAYRPYPNYGLLIVQYQYWKHCIRCHSDFSQPMPLRQNLMINFVVLLEVF